MPTVQVTTSHKLDTADMNKLAQALSASTATILSKPEAYVQVVISNDAVVLFGGDRVDDSAFVRVYSIGEFTAAATKALSIGYASIFKDAGIAPGHLYINFCAMSGANWGCNGRTFG